MKKFLRKKYSKLPLVYFLTSKIDYNDSLTLWNITRIHLEPHEIFQQLLEKDVEKDDSFKSAAVNKNPIIDNLLAFKSEFPEVFE